MIKRCEGCEYELEEAIRLQDDCNLYYATSIDNEYNGKKHFYIYMVDDKGVLNVW